MTNHPDNAPYLGLRPFTESEKDKFFGRDEEIHILTDKILAHRLTLLVAASGVGKSSLLQAGVMPALRASGMADLIYHNDWAVDPARDLKHSIVKHFIQQQRVTADYAPDLDQPLNEFLQTHALLGIGTVVILLDQFEEFFYYQKFSQQRDQFIQQLAAALHDSDTPTAFVFSMREDFAMEMEAFKPFFKGIFDNIYRIEKLELAAARLAILKPIEAIGYHYQPELLEQLLANLGRRERNERLDLQHADQAALTEARVEPPHLQIVCQQLWLHAHASASQAIGLDHYQQLGKAAGILSSYFNDKMAKLDRAQQRLASRAFDLLVSQHGAKMAYPLDELAKLLRENPDSLKISLDQLQTAAILRRIQRQGKPWYELYHDIFAKSITEWNQAYKKKQLREQLLKRGGAGVLTCLTLFAGYDGWENHQQRHFRLGQETVSERVEVYQGKAGSWDIFRQGKFLYESDFERKEIEADKRLAITRMEERETGVEKQIGDLPLSERFQGYAQAGLFESADKVFEAIRKAGKSEWISGLFSPITSVRVPQSLERLLGFKEKNPSQELVLSLEEMNAQQSISKLNKLISDPNSDIWMPAVIALSKLDDATTSSKLLTILEQGNGWDQSTVDAEKLLVRRNEPVTPKLLALLNNKGGGTQFRVLDLLSELNNPAANPKLMAMLSDSGTDTRVRNLVAGILGKTQDLTVPPQLLALLNHRDSNVQCAAAYALGLLKHKAAAPKFLTLLRDNNSNVRRSAADAVATLKYPEAKNKLIGLLSDNDSSVRVSAAKALGAFHDRGITPQLILLLSDNDKAVRSSTARALGELKDRAATRKLIELLNDAAYEVRADAAWALGKIKDPVATPKLIVLLNDSYRYVKNRAARALGNIGGTQATEALIKLLGDDDEHVRRNAAFALGQLKNPIATTTLVSLRDTNRYEHLESEARTILGRSKATIRPYRKQTHNQFVANLMDSRLDDWNIETHLSSALALSHISPVPPEFLAWQKRQLNEIRVELERTSHDELSAKKLGAVFLPESAALLGRLLDDSEPSVLSNALNSLANIGATHSTWLKPYSQKISELARHPDEDVQAAAINALGSLITFADGDKASDLNALDQTIQKILFKIAQDTRKPRLQIAAIDALGGTRREEIAKMLLSLLSNPQYKTLHFNIAFWLSEIDYRPALGEFQSHFDALVQQKQRWRMSRDAGKFVRNSDDLSQQIDKDSWKDDYQLYQYAYALARIAPEKDGVALLSHPLYQVRQAAIQALAEKANGALLQQVLAAHQAFNTSDLPSPFPTTAYRALDKMLYQFEFNGTKADLALLKTLKAKNFPAQPKQQRALNERFDWTIAELEYRLNKQ